MKHVWVIALVAVLGCTDVVDDLHDVEQATGPTTPCPPWRCANSAEVTKFGMHELSIRGEANAQGHRLQLDLQGRPMIYKHGIAYVLSIDQGRLKGTAVVGTGVISGSWLVGAEIPVLVNGAIAYRIAIARVRRTAIPVGPAYPLQVYVFQVLDASGVALGENLCNGASATRAGKLDDHELYGMRSDEALLFTGDRVDPVTMTITPDLTRSWINFGCASFTLAKLYLTRHTTESAWMTNKDINRAMLKMYTADYCGTGDPITISGTPMIWQSNATGYFNAPDVVEARWSSRGATCINKLRLEAFVSPDVPYPRKQLDAICKIPACTDLDPYSFGAGEENGALVSAIPREI